MTRTSAADWGRKEGCRDFCGQGIIARGTAPPQFREDRSVHGTKRTWRDVRLESASLIGHLGSSTFRLPTIATVSTSLAGSCFSSESAPGPFHHGIRRRGGTIF